MRLGYIYFVIALLLFSCQKEDLAGNHTKVIGHGGMGITHDYPLNSFEGIALALNKGAEGVEIDVQMTKDSVLIAYHHEVLEDEMKTSGSVHNKNWSDIRNEEYTELLYAEYGLVSLNDLFRNLQQFGSKTFFFDMKTFSPDTSAQYRNLLVRRLLSIIDHYELTNTVVEVKSGELAQTIKALKPEQRVFAYTDFERAMELCIRYELDGITMDIDQWNKHKVEVAHINGLKTASLNTHSKSRNDLALELGIDYNQTDMVNYALRMHSK